MILWNVDFLQSAILSVSQTTALIRGKRFRVARRLTGGKEKRKPQRKRGGLNQEAMNKKYKAQQNLSLRAKCTDGWTWLCFSILMHKVVKKMLVLTVFIWGLNQPRKSKVVLI